MKYASIFGNKIITAIKQNIITVNSKTYVGKNNIKITKNKIIIDGEDVTPESKEIIIRVEGDLDSIHADNADTIEVLGNVGSITTASGDISCEVVGDIKTMSGDVHCKRVEGDFTSMSGNLVKR